MASLKHFYDLFHLSLLLLIHGDQPWPHGSLKHTAMDYVALSLIHGDQPWPHGSDDGIDETSGKRLLIHGDQPWPHGSFFVPGQSMTARRLIHGDQPWPHGSFHSPKARAAASASHPRRSAVASLKPIPCCGTTRDPGCSSTAISRGLIEAERRSACRALRGSSSTAISRGLIEAPISGPSAPRPRTLIHGDQPWPHGSFFTIDRAGLQLPPHPRRSAVASLKRGGRTSGDLDQRGSSTAISRGLIEAEIAAMLPPAASSLIHGDQPWPHGSAVILLPKR